MEDMYVSLEELKRRAGADPLFARSLLATSRETNPVSALCAFSRAQGVPLYEMDLLCAGEDYYAAMRRSTNGGGENSPLLKGEDDYYELFMEEIRGILERHEAGAGDRSSDHHEADEGGSSSSRHEAGSGDPS